MKPIDIANRNHITLDDMQKICVELGITCSEDADLTEKEVFLLDKRVEVLKARIIEEAENKKKLKKIKLKRKVNIAPHGKEAPVEETARETVENDVVKAPEEKVSEAPKEQPRPQTRPAEHRQGEQRPQQQRPQQQRPAGTGTYQQRPAGSGGTYQQRPAGTGGTYQQRPAGSGGTYQQRPAGTGAPQGTGAGGQNRPRPPYQQTDNRGGKSTDRPFARAAATPLEKPVAASMEDNKKRKKGTEKQNDSRKKYATKKAEFEKSIVMRKKGQGDQKKKEVVSPTDISITENVSVGELAKKLNIKAGEVIAKLMKIGVMATINQIIDADTAAILASEYGTNVKVVSLFDETVIRQEEVDKPDDWVFRPPVVTVMGHVDHGKTKLLDAIRKTNIIDQEFGGITQHIGAYTVEVHGKKITFLDTPGHSAFTTMRARGASVTDIVVLVVAANDGVMPQTIEALNHAKAANVPVIVAINKIDLHEANPAKVRQELSNYGLQPEEWGGTTLFAEISAKECRNIDELLDLILIQAEMLELKANPKLLAKGSVIESRLDMGRGSVSTILIQSGTLRVSDPFVVGVFSGKVRALFDDKGRAISEAGPSVPVEVIGITGVPGAGDPFEGVQSEKMAKQISQKRLEYRRVESAKKVRKVTLESLNDMIKEGAVQELKIIVKGDVDGSVQALTESLEKLSNDEIRVRVIHAGTGGINDSDVMLASASNAVIIGYHVRPTGKVIDLAERESVSVKFYNIIFEATDDIKAAMLGMLSPVFKEELSAAGEIRQVFKISKIGTIAGSVLLEGKIDRKCKIRLNREGIVIFDGAMKSLKRYKDDVSEVVAGQEFGFALEGFNDIREGDNFEAYKVIEVAKTL